MSESEDRFYANPADPHDLWPSVTTILGAAVAKPGLVDWSGRTAADYAVEHHHVIGEMLARDGGADDARVLIAQTARRVRDEAADLGKAFHAVAEAMVKGQPVTLPDEMAQAVQPYLATFDRFLVEMKPDFAWSEATVYNPRHRYAGTCDAGLRLACRGRRFDLADWKTGRTVRWPEPKLQVAGYGMATLMGLRDAAHTTTPMPAVDGHVIIHIRPDGYRVVPVDVTPRRKAAFLHARVLYDEIRDDTGWGRPVWPDGVHVDDCPELDIRVRNALMLRGVVTLADLAAFGADAFLALPHAGPAGLAKAAALLAEEHLTWAATQKGRAA